jgi:isoamylase
MALLLLSQGIPMINAGDEMLRSAGGNNNTWCQDNPLGWIDWSLAERNADMLRFVAGSSRCASATAACADAIS